MPVMDLRMDHRMQPPLPQNHPTPRGKAHPRGRHCRRRTDMCAVPFFHGTAQRQQSRTHFPRTTLGVNLLIRPKPIKSSSVTAESFRERKCRLLSTTTAAAAGPLCPLKAIVCVKHWEKNSLEEMRPVLPTSSLLAYLSYIPRPLEHTLLILSRSIYYPAKRTFTNLSSYLSALFVTCLYRKQATLSSPHCYYISLLYIHAQTHTNKSHHKWLSCGSKCFPSLFSYSFIVRSICITMIINQNFSHTSDVCLAI